MVFFRKKTRVASLVSVLCLALGGLFVYAGCSASGAPQNPCVDNDGDGFTAVSENCNGNDCDDQNPNINPRAEEKAGDDIDSNCDGNKEPTGGQGSCVDSDGDGFKAESSECPSGRDCDDEDASINPDANEAAGDDLDSNCDGNLDPASSSNNGGGSSECDFDGDGFKKDNQNCGGNDCDDNNSKVNPDAEEVCGDGVDQNCDGEDKQCGGQCKDEDGDGYGVEGQNQGCTHGPADCDDQVGTVNPGAKEKCNGRDDDCDGDVDECAREGASCEQGECKAGLGAECESHSECSTPLRCDPNDHPRICRHKEGGSCDAKQDCLTGLSCHNGKCSGDFCAVTTCSEENADRPHCNSNTSKCVECPYWDNGSANCGGSDECVEGGWCAPVVEIPNNDAAGPNGNVPRGVIILTKQLADCWINKKPQGDSDMCATFEVSSSVGEAFSKNWLKGTYTDGDFDFLSQNRKNALENIWGERSFIDGENVNWNSNIEPGSSREYCMWFSPGLPDNVVVDKCKKYLQ